MRTNFEQAPKAKGNSNKPTLSVNLKPTGDEGANSALFDHYESIGYEYKSETKGGTIVMESPVAMQEQRAQDAIKLHNSRTGIMEGMKLERGNIVKDTHERQGVRSASDFMGEIVSKSPQMPDDEDDEL